MSKEDPKFTHKVLAKCTKTNAKVTEYNLTTKVILPIFMPVATYGTMRAIPIDEINYENNYELEESSNKKYHGGIILSNTYHCRNIKRNLKKFMDYSQSMLTDSGGFQIQSLPCKITDEGVEFVLDESKTESNCTTENNLLSKDAVFTPEDSMDVQFTLHADIIMQLDDVVNPMENKERHAEAVGRSIKWLDRAVEKLKLLNKETQLEEKKKKTKLTTISQYIFNDQILFPIIQGGLNSDLRRKSIEDILSRTKIEEKYLLNGIAIGGMCGGEDKNEFAKVVEYCCRTLRNNFKYYGPVYVMGVGYPDDIIVCSALGTDMSDCVYPTRMGRTGKIFWDGEDLELSRIQKTRKILPKLTDESFIYTKLSTITECKCEMCNYSLYYLHLHKDTPNLCNLASKHNLLYMAKLCERIRENIKKDTFVEFLTEYYTKKYGKNIPEWIKTTFQKYFSISL